MGAISVSEMSDLSIDEASQLIGQIVTHVNATEFGLTLTFASGATLEVKGQTYGDCPLGVEFNKAEAMRGTPS